MTNGDSGVDWRPLVIIGAGRSGTNVLRDVLTQIPGFGTWPCDEINYIWRHGNTRYPSDEIPAERATESVRRYIRRQFAAIARSRGITTVVEKTCANSLRVPFVDRILPEARYIQIIRDGRDVVASAGERWTAPLDIPYLARKARYVPPTDLPYYASRYAWNRVHRLFSGEKRLAFWGPRFEGMEDALARYSLAEVCAIQWRRCVELSMTAFADIDPERVYTIRYEEFAKDPAGELANVGRFLRVPIPQPILDRMPQLVSSRSVGRWKTSLPAATVERIQIHTESVLKTLRYE